MIDSPSCCHKCGSPLETGEWGHCSCCLAETLLRPSDPPENPNDSNDVIRRLGDYELIEEIARGAMGVVFRARQRSLKREVAVKVMRDSALARPDDVRRFLTEAAAAAKLRHPHIVAIHEVGEEDGEHFFAMDLIEGENLADRTRNGPLAAHTAAELVVSIAEAVQHAHEEGILHRDLKPSNVLVDALGRPFVTDFGLARPLDTESTLTVPGQILGTPGYMPPEQAKAEGTVGVAADVYSLGALLYHLLTGRAPFVGGSVGETLRHVIEQEPVSPQLLNPEVPRDLASVTLKCLSKDPDRRYPSARALADDLQRFLRGESTLAQPTGRTERLWRWCRRQPVLAGMTATITVLILFVAVASPIVAFRMSSVASRMNNARKSAETNALATRQTLYAGDMKLVQLALAQHNLGAARQLLRPYIPKSGEPDLRGWEWRYYSGQTRGDDIYRVQTNGTYVHSLAASSYLGGILAGWFDGRVELYDAASGRMLSRLMTRDALIGWLTLSDDGRILVTGVASGTPHSLIVWDISDRSYPRELRTFSFPGLFKPFASLHTPKRWIAFSSKFMNESVFDDSGLTTVRNYETGETVRDLVESGHDQIFSRDGKVLVTGSWHGEVKIWDTETWTNRTLGPAGAVIQMALSPDGRLLATSNFEEQVLLWDVAGGQLKGRFIGHSALVRTLQFSPDGTLLATASHDQTIGLWNVATQEEVRRFRGHEKEVFSVAFSLDGKWLATGSLDSSLRFWRVEPAAQGRIAGHATTPAAYSPDGRMVAFGNRGGQVDLWDAQAERIIRTLSSEPNPVGFSREGAELITAIVPTPLPITTNYISGLKFWDLESGTSKRVLLFSPSNQPISAVKLSPDRSALATGDTDGNILLWDTQTGTIRDRMVFDGTVIINIVFSPDSQKLAFVGGVYEINALTNNQKLSLTGNGRGGVWGFRTKGFHQFNANPVAIAFSADGKILACGNYNEILLLDAATTNPLGTLSGHRETVGWLAFSPEGQNLVSAGEEIKVWNLATRREVASFLPNSHPAYVEFSPDGEHLLSIVGKAGDIHTWTSAAGDRNR